MQLISELKKGFRYLLCVIDIYSKYMWFVLSKDKKSITITNAFQKILDESGCKPNKVWEDKGSEFYHRSMKSWLQDNYIEMYSAHNEGKSVFAEKSIKKFKSKIHKYMISVSKIVYIDKLDV